MILEGSDHIDDQTKKNKQIIQMKQVPLKLAKKECNLIIIKNISDLVNYQQIEMQSKLYELFTATVSHEMRTPLNSILSLLKIVITYIKDDRIKNQLSIAYSSAEMLRYQVNDMLDLFAIKTDRFKKSEIPANMHFDVIKQVYDIFVDSFILKGLQLNFTMEERVPEILIVDSQRLR